MDGERSSIVLPEAPTRQSCHERPTQSFTLGRSKLGSAFDRPHQPHTSEIGDFSKSAASADTDRSEVRPYLGP